MNDWKRVLEQAQTHLRTNDKALRKLISRIGDCELLPHTDYFRALLRSIIGQQLSVKAAATIYQRFLDLFGGSIPTPDALLAAEHEALRSVGLSNSKSLYVKDLAQHIVDKRLDLASVVQLPNEELIARLTDVKGIGTWSAHMFMIFSLGRLDILPTGDLGIATGMMKVYQLPARPTPLEIVEIAEKNQWAPYQSVASWYIWRSLDNTPT